MVRSYHPDRALWSLGPADSLVRQMEESTLPGFADALRREIMRSEILRVRVLAYLLLFLLVATTTATVTDVPAGATVPVHFSSTNPWQAGQKILLLATA